MLYNAVANMIIIVGLGRSDHHMVHIDDDEKSEEKEMTKAELKEESKKIEDEREKRQD